VISLVRRAWGLLVAKVGPTAIKYTIASVISVAVTEVLLFLIFGVFRMFDAVASNIVATGLAAIPSYYLNRNWAWGKNGRSHLWREVVPFWGLAFLGLALSIVTVDWTQAFATQHGFSHLVDALFVNLASLAAFGIVWIGKFFIFNLWMFGSRAPAEVE